MSQMNSIPDVDPYDTNQRPTRMVSTVHDLPRDTREPVVRRLNGSLADTTDLVTQMKTAHWNVKGIHFYQLHLLFDETAEMLERHADMLAERVTALGGQARGTVRMAARDSRIPELDDRAVTGEEFLQETIDHLTAHAANVRANIDYAADCGDEGTADLYTEISREIDQHVYFLESHLQTRLVDTGRRTDPTSGQSHPGGRDTPRNDPSRQGGQSPGRRAPGNLRSSDTLEGPSPGQSQY